MNWCDLVIIIIVTYYAGRGFFTGLILSLTGLLAFVIGLIVAIKYNQALTDYLIVGWQLDEKLAALIKPLLNFWMPVNATTGNLLAIEQLASKAESLSPQFLTIVQNINAQAEQALGDVQNTIFDMFSLLLAQGLLTVIAFITLLLVTAFIIKIMGGILNSLMNWGILAPFNRLGGLFFGVARGLLVVFVIMALLMPLQIPAVLMGGETMLTAAVQNSYLANIFWQLITEVDWKPAGVWLQPKDLEIYLDYIQ